jgi:hypothetical protein
MSFLHKTYSKAGLDSDKVIMHQASIYMTSTLFRSEVNFHWDSCITYESQQIITNTGVHTEIIVMLIVIKHIV